MITYGSAQVNGLPLTISTITPGTRQLLHTAPPGDATPHRIMVYGAMLDGYVATYLKIVVETADGETLRTTCKYLKGNAFQPCFTNYLQLNGGCRVSVYAEGANACMAMAQVDDQAGIAGTAVQAISSGRITAVRNAARYATGVQGGAGQATEAAANIQITRAGVLRNLRAVAAAAVGSAASVDITVRKNGTATALTVNFSAADGTAAKTVADSVPVAAGDLICFEVKETADAAPAASFQASVEYLATVQKVTAIPLGIATGAPTVGAPALLGIADLTPLGIAAGSPTVGAPVLRGVTALTPLGIATGAPTVGSPALEDVPSGPSRWARFNTTSDFPLVPADAGAVTVLGYRLQFKARINPYSSTLIITGSVNLVNFIVSSGTVGKASIFTMAIMQRFVPPDNVAVMWIQLQCPLDVYPWNATRESYVVLTNDGQWHDYAIAISVDGELPGIMIINEDMPAGVLDTSFSSGDDLSSFVAVLSSAAPVDLADVVHVPKGSGPIMEVRGTYAFDETSGTTAYDSSGDNDISGVNADIWTPT